VGGSGEGDEPKTGTRSEDVDEVIIDHLNPKTYLSNSTSVLQDEDIHSDFEGRDPSVPFRENSNNFGEENFQKHQHQDARFD
jgi:hypothetical protein